MPDFRPFRGIRYDPATTGTTDLTSLAAPPYDVVDDERRAHLRATSPHNAIHLTLPEAEGRTDRYEHAAALFDRWLDQGVLAADPSPRFYRYRVAFSDHGRPRTTTGVIGALEVVPPGREILPHERTMPKPKGDRLDLLRATRANLEPIWGLSLAHGLTRLLDDAGELLASVTDTRDARHELHAISDADQIAAVERAVAGAPVVIADGHHRFETSLHYRHEREEAGDPPGEHARIMCLVVELTDDELAVQPIHRLLRGLPGDLAVREIAARWFDVVDLGPNEPEAAEGLPARMHDAGALALADPQGLALLVPRAADLAGPLQSEPEPVRTVDSARFEATLAPVLADAGAEVEYRHDHVAATDMVRKGAIDASVLLRPVDVPTIEAVAASAERMPPKTTFFHPKPSTGLVFRSLDVV